MKELTENPAADSLSAMTGNKSFAETRRKFLAQMGLAGVSLASADLLFSHEALARVFISEAGGTITNSLPAADTIAVKLRLNGAVRMMQVEPRVFLVDALREQLQLPGTKKGCDHGQCGACTVLIDGRRVLSCLTLTAMCEGQTITTVEGLSNGDELHPVQTAFIKHDGFQCGYCTPGQLCSAVALLQEAKNGDASYITEDLPKTNKNLALSDDEIRERMSGNICRCGAYPNIVAAVQEVHSGKATGETA